MIAALAYWQDGEMKLLGLLCLLVISPSCAHHLPVTDPKVEYLYDRTLIEETVNELFINTDNKNWPAIQNLMTTTVEFDMTSLAGGLPQVLTPKAITDLWVEGLTPVAAVHHQSGNFIITLAGNNADVFCYGTATHYKNPQFRKKTVVSFVGSYNLHLKRVGTDWKISALKFNKKYVE